MRTFSLILFFLFFVKCQKNEDCIIIIEKRSVDDKYYFLFETENLNDTSLGGNNSQSTNIPDKYSSGQVDNVTYNSYNIGDTYCTN